MFTTLITHAKTIALAGTLTCGGDLGTHAAYSHLHQQRTPVRYEQRFDQDDRRLDRDDRKPTFDNHRSDNNHSDHNNNFRGHQDRR